MRLIMPAKIRAVARAWLFLAPMAALAVTTAAATPPPPDLLATDCGTQSYASDALVCEDPALRDLNDRMTRVLEPYGITQNRERAAEQAAWYRRSRLCAFEEEHRECLVAAYCSRLQVIGPSVEPEDCRPAEQDYMAANRISRAGFLRDTDLIDQREGKEILLWGYVDTGNIFADADARSTLGDLWSGQHRRAGHWRFGLKGRSEDATGQSFEVQVRNDILREDVLRVLATDAAAGRLTKIFLKGRLATFDAPLNQSSRVGIRVDVSASWHLRIVR
jgi:uncharacterized protein